MKNEFKPKCAGKGFCIPDEIVDGTTLKEAENLDTYSNRRAVLLLDREMTAKEIVQTVDMLNTVCTGLIMRLERAAMQHEENCRRICIPAELLEMAGIPQNAPLNIEADDGEIYISAVREGEDLPENLPSFLRELFSDCEVDAAALRWLFESEAIIGE